MIDQTYYDIVANEIKTGKIDNGLWTRAYAEALGDERKAKALYINYRVNQLNQKDTAPAVFEKEKQKPKPLKKRSLIFIYTVILIAVITGFASIAYLFVGYPEAAFPLGLVAILCVVIAIDHFVSGQ